MKKQSGVQINLSGRDLVIVVAFLLGIPVGGFTWLTTSAGTPGETTKAVEVQTEALTGVLDEIRDQLEEVADATDDNSAAIQRSNRDANQRMDSLFNLTMDGLKNLDGYFHGRLDAMDGN